MWAEHCQERLAESELRLGVADWTVAVVADQGMQVVSFVVLLSDLALMVLPPRGAAVRGTLADC